MRTSHVGPGCLRIAALFALAGGRGGRASWADPCSGPPAANGALDHSVLNGVLAAHVRQGAIGGIRSTLVDYGALRRDPSGLRAYLGQLCPVDVYQLPPAEALAVLINAYNAVMLAIVVHFAPARSVKELHQRVPGGSIWKHKFATLGGVRVSLDDIEHGMIRGAGFASRVGAAGRVHAALNCASLSCPDLQPAAFHASALDAQLTAATRQWLGNPTKNPGPDSSGALVLSKIFDWYGGDFQAAAGSVHAFVRMYSAWQFSDGAALRFAEYDWSLNKVGGVPSSSGAARRCSAARAAALAAALPALAAGG